MASTAQPNLGIHSNWALGDNGWDTEMNNNLKLLDAIVNGYMISDTTDVPGAPATGDRYIIPAGATGAWVGQDNNIARYNGTSWDIYTTKLNWIVYVGDAAAFKRFDGANWVSIVAGGGGGSSFTITTAQTGALAAFDVWLADVSSTVQTRALPATPSDGDEVIIVDDQGNAATNTITVGRNGKNIMGSATDLTITVNYQRVRLKYLAATTDWRIIMG